MNRTSALQSTATLLQLRSAYLLVSHGSRDPRPQAAVEQLAELLKVRVEAVISCPLDYPQFPQNPSPPTAPLPVDGEGLGVGFFSDGPFNRLGVSGVQKTRSLGVALSPALPALVGTATLELATLPLHEQIRQFGDRAKSVGYKHLQVLPLFLLPGVHVMEDIPAEVALAQKALGSELTIDLRPYLGAHPGLGRLLATQLAAFHHQARILLSHGSRLLGANQPVEVMATQLEAVPAYWSVPPSLESRVEELVNAGHRQIAILPYFLFAGGITDAIAQSVEQLPSRFPTVRLSLSDPIGASSELADLILDLTID